MLFAPTITLDTLEKYNLITFDLSELKTMNAFEIKKYAIKLFEEYQNKYDIYFFRYVIVPFVFSIILVYVM